MLVLIKMAWRNLWRNSRRTVLTISSITIGLMAIVFLFGFMDGMSAQTLENNIRGHTGHIKIYPKGYQDAPSVSKKITGPEGMMDLLSQISHIVSSLPRIEGQGLMATDVKSTGVMILGIDLKKEEDTSDYKGYVREGTYGLQKGGIMVGKNLAKMMKTRIGDTVSLIVQAADGSIGAENFRIEGIIETGEFTMDSSLTVMSIEDAGLLLGMEGGVSEITLFLDRSEHTDRVIASLKNRLDMEKYELADWRELLTNLVELINLSEVFKYIPLIILIVVASLGILNTILMSVLERTREFGIMTALGTGPSRIMALILIETIMMTAMGIFLGVPGGVALLSYFNKIGIDLSQWAEGVRIIPFHPTTVYPILEPEGFYVAVGVVFISAILSSLYPAYRAATLRPVEALRFV